MSASRPASRSSRPSSSQALLAEVVRADPRRRPSASRPAGRCRRTGCPANSRATTESSPGDPHAPPEPHSRLAGSSLSSIRAVGVPADPRPGRPGQPRGGLPCSGRGGAAPRKSQSRSSGRGSVVMPVTHDLADPLGVGLGVGEGQGRAPGAAQSSHRSMPRCRAAAPCRRSGAGGVVPRGSMAGRAACGRLAPQSRWSKTTTR